MIIKERNTAEHPEPDKFEAAGIRAEEQMAFYLKRAFGDAKDVLVAISDHGSIDRGNSTYPEVLKAEAVVPRIKEIIARHRLGILTPTLNPNVGAEKFSDEELIKIRDFLKRQHAPRVKPQPKPVTPPVIKAPPPPPRPPVAPPPPPRPPVAPPAPPTVAAASPGPAPVAEAPNGQKSPPPACRHCQSARVRVEYGQYGYYLKCGDCGKNTAIDFTCPACGKKGRVRKEKERFFKECEPCGASALYHVNA